MSKVNGHREVALLTKRELLAGMAMQAELIGNCLVNKESGSSKDLAFDAVDLADALLEALEPEASRG